MKNITKEELYIRQTTLHEIGKKGQQKLLETKVLVVGCGGLGNTAAVYLAASGIGFLHLVDFDKVSESNLHRQVFYKTKDIDKPKVEVLAAHIRSISPFVKVKISSTPLSKANALDLVSSVDYILDCTDSLPTKYLLNDACVLKNKPLIYGSLYKFDGYVASFNVKLSDEGFASNLRDAFPEMTKQQVPNCSEVGTLNTIVGMIGLMQANEVLKLVTGIGKPLINELLIYNSLDNSQFKMKLKSKAECHSEQKQSISEIFKKTSYFDPNCEVQDESLLISAKDLKAKLSLRAKSRGLNIISVIEDLNTTLPFEVNTKIPFSKLDDLLDHIEHVTSSRVERRNIDQEYIIICNRGISSYTTTKKIKEKYPDLNVLSLHGGITNY